MEFINQYEHNFTINYHSYDGDVQYVSIPFKFLNRCPNKCYLTCLLKYKNMCGWNVVDDYLLAWFHENLTGKCGEKSSKLKKDGHYNGLWKFKNILCNGVRSNLVNEATRLPHGWIWVKPTGDENTHMRILKFRFTDENFYKIEDDDVGMVTTFNFYNNDFQKICEIKEKEPRAPFKKAIAKALGLQADDKKITKIINKSIRQSKKTFAVIPAFKIEDLNTNKMYVQKETKIKFIKKINTTEGFWEVYLKEERIPSRVFNIEGYRLFCTGFPRPFIPPPIEDNRWVRLFTSVETVGCTQAYDMWILQSELKEFYKHMIELGKGRSLVECLGLEVDNTPERIRAANTIQKFYKKRRKKNFVYVGFLARTTSSQSIESEEDSEGDWEKNLDDINERIDKECKIMSKKLKREKSEEEKQLKEDIENSINNNKIIIKLNRELQGINKKYNAISNRNNKIKKYITAWESKKLSEREESYFHIWWFLSFGQNFFTYYRGNVVGGGGKKAAFYNKETAKYLAEGDMKFIFKNQNLRECLNRFQSLVSIIDQSLNNKDKFKNDHAYEELGSVMTDSKASVDNYINTSSLFSGSYADALQLLPQMKDIRKLCCKKIVKELKEVVKENDRKIEFHLKNINKLNDMITIQKELIKNSYKYLIDVK